MVSLLSSALSASRFRFTTEIELQDLIAGLLSREHYSFAREHSLSSADRVDFFVYPGLAVEVKIGGSSTPIIRQLHRYAQNEKVTELMLVTSSMRHVLGFPARLNGKPVTCCYLAGSAF